MKGIMVQDSLENKKERQKHYLKFCLKESHSSGTILYSLKKSCGGLENICF
jgi:hypothetical protein